MRSGDGFVANRACRRNVFWALMEALKTHSLGQISHALYDVDRECSRDTKSGPRSLDEADIVACS